MACFLPISAGFLSVDLKIFLVIYINYDQRDVEGSKRKNRPGLFCLLLNNGQFSGKTLATLLKALQPDKNGREVLGTYRENWPVFWSFRINELAKAMTSCRSLFEASTADDLPDLTVNNIF